MFPSENPQTIFDERPVCSVRLLPFRYTVDESTLHAGNVQRLMNAIPDLGAL
jgi:hypothetical protein